MKILFSITLTLISVFSFAANRFWIGGGSNSNWSASPTTNWSATSGGTTRVAAPTSADAVFFDGVGTNANTASIVSASTTCLSITFSSGYTNTITINTAVTLTVAGNFTDVTNHSWTVNGTGALAISATSTITSGGKTFPGPVTFSGASTTKTLSGNWTITGALTVSSNSQIINATTAETLSAAGLTMNGALSAGTAKIILTGGTWSGTANSTLNNNLDFAGNVTLSGNIYFGNKTVTYVSGTITQGTSTLNLNATGAGGTFNTNGMSWANITFGSLTTSAVLSSLLTCSGTLSMPSGVTFSGSGGFTVGTLAMTSVSATTLTLANTVTYTVTTSLNLSTSRTGSPQVVTSDHATNKAILTLNKGATCNVLANFTRIDASAGRTIWTFNGVITSCNNIASFTELRTKTRNFIQ